LKAALPKAKAEKAMVKTSKMPKSTDEEG